MVKYIDTTNNYILKLITKLRTLEKKPKNWKETKQILNTCKT